MYKCENCGKEFEIDYRKIRTIKNNHGALPRFCSRTCARQNNGKIIKYKQDVCQKCGKDIQIRKGTEKKFCEKCLNSSNVRYCNRSKLHYANFESIDIDQKYLIEGIKEFENKYNISLIESDFDSISFDLKRKRILLEQDGKCAHCGLSEWMGKPIALEIDHKDGNNQNDERENLEAICPNCHSMTPTWRGRNKANSIKGKISDDNIIQALIETGNIRQCLIKVGLTPKGNNYGRVKKILTMRGIDYSNVPEKEVETI